MTLSDISAAAGAATAGAAASNNNTGAASAALAITLGGMSLVEAYSSGYSKELDKKADRLAYHYFNKNKKDSSIFVNVFKKLMFSNLCLINEPDPKSSSHPLLVDRIRQLSNLKVSDLTHTSPYVIKDRGTQTTLNLISIEVLDRKETLVVYLNDYKMLDEIIDDFENTNQSDILISLGDILVELNAKYGDKSVKYSIDKNAITQDTWGALLSFSRNIENDDEVFMKNPLNLESLFLNYSPNKLGMSFFQGSG